MNIPPCPSCQNPYGYEMNGKLVCPECGFEWTIAVEETEEAGLIVKDANGNVLNNGDSVVTI
jgi:protein PhnA